MAATCVLCVAQPLFAQDWIQYKNLQDHFAVTAPGQPTVEKIQWASEYGSQYPGAAYRWVHGQNRYSVTVVDYSDAEAIYYSRERSIDFQQAAYWQIDILGSVQYAATKYRQRPGVKVTYDAFHYINLIIGHQLQITNTDESKTYVSIYLHENRLYVFDATVTKGNPPPLMFQQSVEILDAEGNSIRYRTYYYNKLPEPRRVGRRGGGGGPGAGGPPQGERGGAPPQQQP